MASPARRRLLLAAALTAAGASRHAHGMAPTRSEFRTSDGVRLSLLEAGRRGPQPSVLLLPGWGMPASLWTETLRALAPQRHAVALDPRGQGESEVPPNGYTIERRVADLAELIARLERVVLVGWSLGVLESLHYAHLHGEDRLAGLVLVDNSVGEPPAPKPTDFLKRLRADRAATLDRFVRGMFAAPPPESLIAEVTRSALRTSLEQSIALLSYPLPREHWRNIARALRVPLAYLVTRRFAEQAQNLKAARPATTIEVFDGAGHALFIDQPARFGASLDAFLSRLA